MTAKSADRNFILDFTPTGMIPTKQMTPHVPVQPEEIVQQVLEAAELGVNMVHIHARNFETGEPTCKKEIYGEIISGIRKHNKNIVLCVSTSGRNFSEFAKRSECLDPKGDAEPDFGSLTLSSLNFNKQASINSPEMIQKLAGKMMAAGIRPELEAFDLGMINYAKYLIRKHLIKPLCYFNLILGNIACAQHTTILNLGLMINELPENSIWSVSGIGDWQLQMNATSLFAGGVVRVGLEDNIYFDPDRKQLASNRKLIERVLTIAKSLGREPYSHRNAREILCE